MTFAIGVEYLSSCGVAFGAPAMINGVSGGPMIWPIVATGPMMRTPAIDASFCHLSHASQIAFVIPSMNAPTLAMCIFCTSVSYLFRVAGWNSGGIPGLVDFSLSLNAPWYILPASPDGSRQLVGTFRLKLVNFNRAKFFIASGCGAGMNPRAPRIYGSWAVERSLGRPI